jgi:hypothetical protein
MSALEIEGVAELRREGVAVSAELAVIDEPTGVEAWLNQALEELHQIDEPQEAADLAMNASRAARALKVLGAAEEMRARAVELELRAYRQIGHLGLASSIKLHSAHKRACWYVAARTDTEFEEVLALRFEKGTGIACTQAHRRVHYPSPSKAAIRGGGFGNTTGPAAPPRPLTFKRALVCLTCGWSEGLDVEVLLKHTAKSHGARPLADRVPVLLSEDGAFIAVPVAEWLEAKRGESK